MTAPRDTNLIRIQTVLDEALRILVGPNEALPVIDERIITSGLTNKIAKSDSIPLIAAFEKEMAKLTDADRTPEKLTKAFIKFTEQLKGLKRQTEGLALRERTIDFKINETELINRFKLHTEEIKHKAEAKYLEARPAMKALLALPAVKAKWDNSHFRIEALERVLASGPHLDRNNDMVHQLGLVELEKNPAKNVKDLFERAVFESKTHTTLHAVKQTEMQKLIHAIYSANHQAKFDPEKLSRIFLDTHFQSLNSNSDKEKLQAAVANELGVKSGQIPLTTLYDAAMETRRAHVDAALATHEPKQIYASIALCIDNLPAPNDELQRILNKSTTKTALANNTVNIPELLKILEHDNHFICEKMTTMAEKLAGDIKDQHREFTEKFGHDLDRKKNNNDYVMSIVSSAWKFALSEVKKLSSESAMLHSQNIDAVAGALTGALSAIPIPGLGALASAAVSVVAQKYKDETYRAQFHDADLLEHFNDDLKTELTRQLNQQMIDEQINLSRALPNPDAKTLLYQQFQAANQLDLSQSDAMLAKARDNYREHTAAALANYAALRLQQYDPTQTHAKYFTMDAQGNTQSISTNRAELEKDIARQAWSQWLAKRPSMERTLSKETWIKLGELGFVKLDESLRKESAALRGVPPAVYERDTRGLGMVSISTFDSLSPIQYDTHDAVKQALHKQAAGMQSTPMERTQSQDSNTNLSKTLLTIMGLPPELHQLQTNLFDNIKTQLEKNKNPLAAEVESIKTAFEEKRKLGIHAKQDALIDSFKAKLTETVTVAATKQKRKEDVSKVTTAAHTELHSKLSEAFGAKSKLSTTAKLTEYINKKSKTWWVRKNDTKINAVKVLQEQVQKLETQLQTPNPNYKQLQETAANLALHLTSIQKHFKGKSTLDPVLDDINKKIQTSFEYAAKKANEGIREIETPAESPTVTMRRPGK